MQRRNSLRYPLQNFKGSSMHFCRIPSRNPCGLASREQIHRACLSFGWHRDWLTSKATLYIHKYMKREIVETQDFWSWTTTNDWAHQQRVALKSNVKRRWKNIFEFACECHGMHSMAQTVLTLHTLGKAVDMALFCGYPGWSKDCLSNHLQSNLPDLRILVRAVRVPRVPLSGIPCPGSYTALFDTAYLWKVVS